MAGSVSVSAQVSPRNLLLEVFINGNDTEKVGSFLEKDGHFYVTAAELRSLGLSPPLESTPDTLIDLATLVSKAPMLDERTQTIALSVPVHALAAHQIGEDALNRKPGPSTASPPGVLVNYDTTATLHAGALDAYGFVSARLFSVFGTVQNDMSIARFGSEFRAVRLATTYSYSDPEQSRTYSVGDFISAALPYSRSLRIGGIQVSTNFAIRPDLITYPVPIISGGAAVPSTVDVFVNGVRQLSTPVEAGPFSVPQLPVVTGAGQLSVAVRDAAGRQTVQTSSFYISSALLKPGLSSFSAEAGAIRRGFGVDSASYGPLAIAVTDRRGLAPSLTLEGHAEMSGSLGMAVGGATFGIRNLAVATAALGGSRSSSGSGWQSYFALERTALSYHLGFSALTSSSRFRDLGVTVGDQPPRHVVQANAGITLGRQGSLGLAYTDIAQRRSTLRTGLSDPIVVPARRASLLSGTYSRELFGRAYFYVTGYGELGSRNRAVSAGISFRFGGQSAISSSYESAARQGVVEASHPAVESGEIGWHAYAAHGVTDRLLGEVSYRGSRGEVGLGVDSASGANAVRASARGSLVMLGGSVFAAPLITDAFALVDTQGFANVAVAVNNRPAGHTDKSGKLLVPGLVSYQANGISIDPGDLPLDTHWDRLDMNVMPSDRAGIIAQFGMRRQHEALVSLHLANGQPLPLGAQISLDGKSEMTEAGFDGQVYYADLQGAHRLVATMPDGTRCHSDIIVAAAESGPVAMQVLCK